MPFHIPNLFSEYLRHQDINDYLDYLQITYPHLVTVSVPGYSYEQRPIKLIRISSKEMYKSKISLTSSSTSITSALSLAKPKSALKISTAATCRKSRSAVPASRQRTTNAIHHRIGTKNNNNSNNNANIHQNGSNPARCNTANNFPKQQQQQAKPLTKSIVLIDGGLHAREWAAISTALYCISQLVENFECNRKLLLCYDFVIVPVVNVDGYEYSHTTNRMWRKTRRPNDGTQNIGTDCNRNFSSHWQRACSRPSKHTYRGDTPFSEPETKILRHLMHTLQPNFYLTLHSYAKSLMYPYGYTRKLPENWRELHELARAGHTAILKKTGTKYRVGNVSSLINQKASGGSPDYALDVVKTPFVITMEISGGQFQPPNSEIRRIVEESWIGIKAMCLFLNVKK